MAKQDGLVVDHEGGSAAVPAGTTLHRRVDPVERPRAAAATSGSRRGRANQTQLGQAERDGTDHEQTRACHARGAVRTPWHRLIMARRTLRGAERMFVGSSTLAGWTPGRSHRSSMRRSGGWSSTGMVRCW